jgi:hypothetical protein
VKLVRSIGRNVDGVTGPNDDQVFPDKYGPYKDLAVDSRWEKITPPMCLTHSTGLILAFWFGPPTAVKFGPLGQHWLGFVDGATEA